MPAFLKGSAVEELRASQENARLRQHIQKDLIPLYWRLLRQEPDKVLHSDVQTEEAGDVIGAAVAVVSRAYLPHLLLRVKGPDLTSQSFP